jgi:hypothetical protein
MVHNPAKDCMIRRRVALGTARNFTGQMLLFAICFRLTPLS